MKKLFALGFTTIVLAGCSGINFLKEETPAATTTAPGVTTETSAAAFTQTDFVNLSAEILCSKVKNPTADEAAQKAAAADVLAKAKITGKVFTDFRAGLEVDATQKQAVGYAIVGRMNELCPTNGATATTTTPAATGEATTPVTTDATQTPATTATSATDSAKTDSATTPATTDGAATTINGNSATTSDVSTQANNPATENEATTTSGN